MATLDIEPVELPPGRIEELPLTAETPERKAIITDNPSANQAQPVNGTDLLQSPETPPNTPNQPAEEKLPPLGPNEYRKMEDYRKLDWSKSNSQLAEIAGVSRARIGQVRKLIEAERANQPKQSDNVPAADFSDIGAPPGATGVVPPVGGNGPSEPRPDYMVMAKTTFAMSEGILCAVFGNEWKRETEEEAMSVCIPLSVCYEKWGMSDLPPGYVLCFVCLAYAGKRMNKPTTKDKLARAWLWLKAKFHRKKRPMAVTTEQKAA